MAKRKEPCKWRYKGICRHGESKWYDDKVTGIKKKDARNVVSMRNKGGRKNIDD